MIDRVIQDNQPLFVFVWVGSVVMALVAAALSLWAAVGLDRALVLGAALVYVLGVQVPIGTINIPLNNEIQRLEVAMMTDAARQDARAMFERRWNQWNVTRTVVAVFTSALLLIVLLSS